MGGEKSPTQQIDDISGQLCNTLLRRGLVDEYRRWVVPVIWGSGKLSLAEQRQMLVWRDDLRKSPHDASIRDL
jgi:hypothetical protein